jgi:tetratricopeptide (TPR) repeat protein
MEFTKLEPKFLARFYPVKENPKEEDVAAFAAWLYSKKATSNPELKLVSDVANQVLTILATSKQDLKPLVEAWIIEKENWKAAPGDLEIFNAWDLLFQDERDMFVNKDLKDKLVSDREKAAKDEYTDILKVRGNYDKRQRPPRKPLPTQQLVLIDWRIREFRRTFGSSTFFKGKDVDTKLIDIQDSIAADLDTIKDLKKQAGEAKKDGKPDLQKRAEIMAIAGSLDPEDLALCGEIAQAWMVYANIAGHGNSCDHVDGAKGAVPYIEKILKVYPENTSWLIRLGNCYQAMGDGKAKSYYKRVIEICGKDKGDGKNASAFLDNMDKTDAARAGKGGGK